jgi:hypothetical protein
MGHAHPYGGDSSYIYFGGTAKERSIALVGSPRHVIGQATEWKEKEEFYFSGYFVPEIIDTIKAFILDEQVSSGSDYFIEDLQGLKGYIKMVNKGLADPPQKLEFLARLLCETSDAVLGTPIYVALAGQEAIPEQE